MPAFKIEKTENYLYKKFAARVHLRGFTIMKQNTSEKT
jgi:hypothetical protein